MKNEMLNSVLQSFELRGLHGYKDVGFDCRDPSSIVLAENGAGKTTLLNTLYALLSGRISRLATTDFSEAELKFSGGQIVFSKEQAFKSTPGDIDQLLRKRQVRELLEYGVSQEQLVEMLRVFVEHGVAAASRTAAFRSIYRSSPYSEESLMQRLVGLRAAMYDSTYIAAFRKQVAEAMMGMQVLYLPTYRRIEASFEDVSLSRNTPGRRDVAADSESLEPERDELIYFGLRDVEDKISKMMQFIQRSMFGAYSQLSGNLIDALIGAKQYRFDLDESIDVAAVRLMLSRLGKSSTVNEEELENAINGVRLADERYKPLAYFLRELLRSYEASRPQELAIEEFVSVVNGYLSVDGSGEKKLKFDKVGLKVEVWNDAIRKALPFGCLSSGEKQIISIFARLILDGDRKYLILIDEPELSLSIEWQRRFLPDVIKTSSCSQLIAITHSPFVFENELDRFARSISVSSKGLLNG